jgi:hypothetical protein
LHIQGIEQGYHVWDISEWKSYRLWSLVSDASIL